MTARYGGSAGFAPACVPLKARAPAQHAVYRWLFDHPGATLAAASDALHLDYAYVRLVWSRIRHRPDFGRLCPECFAPSFYRLACHACGFEAPRQDAPLAVDFASQGPVHRVQPLGGLGSSTDYRLLHPSYGHRNVQHLAEQAPDRALERLRSRLWNELEAMDLLPSDGEVEAATRMLEAELKEFRASYPQLARAHGLAETLVGRVMARVRLLHGANAAATPQQAEGGFT